MYSSMNRSLTAEERITKQRSVIMRDHRFVAIAGILMIGTWSVTDKPRMFNGQEYTACTNGRDTIFGRSFITGLNDKQLRFLILHEAYHIMFMHMTMWKHLFKEDMRLAGIATDMVINCSLDNTAGAKADKFIEFIPGGVLDHSFDGLDTGEVYRRLKKQQQGQGQGQGQSIDGHDTDNAEAGAELSDEEVKELQQQIDTTIRQGAQMVGKLGGTMDRAITDLLEVSVNWQEQLRDFVTTNAKGNDLSTWRKPSRRSIARGVYMPSSYSEAAKRITIGVDTSGSITNNQLRRALTEIKGVCDMVIPEIVDMIYWDSEVVAHEVYEGTNVCSIVDATKPAGGGGTRVGSMLQYMRNKDIKPDVIVIFTDGYVEADWGGSNWPAPVMWCISTKGKTAPHGKSLYVPVDSGD